MESVIVWHRWSAPLEPTQEAVALAAWWRRTARERFSRAGAEVLFELGGGAAFALAGAQLGEALDLCARLARDCFVRSAEDTARGAQAGGIACGIALGPLWRAEGESVYVGDAIERAQVLAHAAGAHEVLIDAAARASSAAEFLFARDLTLADGLRASALDPHCARKSECTRAVTMLQRPSPPESAGAPRALLARLASNPGRQRVLLVAPHGHGVGVLLDELAQQVNPSAWLALRAPGASLAPLSGLASALRTVTPAAAPEQVLVAPDDREREARAQLIAIREGDAVPRRDVIVALRRYLLRLSERGRRPLITVDPAPLIDPSSVGVIAEAVRDGASAPLVIMRMLLDTRPPSSFGRDGGFTELRLPALERHEAQALAAELLGIAPGDDIARRAAVLGGDNPQAVVEAVRGMVAAGDVVRDGAGFRWRRGPVAASSARALEALLAERIDGLAQPARRALEILATVPDAADQALGAAIAEQEGLPGDAWALAVHELTAMGFVQQLGAHAGVGPVVRQVLRGMTAAPRAVALHRAVADALVRTQRGPARFARATLAYYLAHAGSTDEAATLFLEVATLAGQLGYLRSGVRLAASAVECDPSLETRSRAAQLAQRLSAANPGGHDGASTRVSQAGLPAINLEAPLVEERPSLGAPQSLAGTARARAVEAIRARDYEEVERAIDLLTAAGQTPESIERLRAVTLLAKGDPAGARDVLDRQRACDGGPTPRLTLTEALAALASGEHELAVRASLEALARTREAGDARGERASLSVLSLCYRELGREADARRFAEAALAP